MKEMPTLIPTADQTFEIAGGDFARILTHGRELQRKGCVEEACDRRYQAFQRIVELLPEEEEIVLEWNDRNTSAAVEVIHDSAVDHFLAGDFELSTAMLELLLELDPEDHLEATALLAFDYVAMEEYELFDEVIDDLPEKSAERELLTLWAAFRRDGHLSGTAIAHAKTHPWFAEFVADEHPADEAYLHDIEGERPTPAAHARELWLRTEHLWARFPEFIAALREG